MTRNREVFISDPLTHSIPNNGVAKVIEPHTDAEWSVLRYELESFVCEGEYRRGLERILETYLANLDKAEQPAVWVNGFYGSGKSHLLRVLEYLWRDVKFPDGATARGLTRLPQSIKDALAELTSQGKRDGGLWSAAGTLGAGISKSIRLGMLSVLFRSAGLPEQYAPAQFVIWLQQNGYYEGVRTGVEKAGKEFERELNNLWVSPLLANSLLQVAPDFANDQIQAREFFRARYPNRMDISDEELLVTINDILGLVSNKPGKRPCTLLVFDELQQFISEDPERTLQVQNIVEACSARFGSRVLFVASGQAALQSNPQLSKLKGRFTVQVTLEDKDVEQVVREVVLRKKDDQKPALQAVLEHSSGEISRHLEQTRIAWRASDTEDLVPDYPLLPVRRRFWESVLREFDRAGTASQLRTQLRIVHEAAREVGEQPLGNVVAGDFIYQQLKPDMLQSGMLLREIDVAINEQAKKDKNGGLRARLCSLIFLIGKLPGEGAAAAGIRPTAAALADLLVEDLTASSAALRLAVSQALQGLAEDNILMAVGDEYRLQTRESSEWEQDYKTRFTQIKNDEARQASDRQAELKTVIQEALKGTTFTQGVSKTPRRYELYYGQEAPKADSGAVPVWIRDEWTVSEKAVREDAQREGINSPLVFVLVPRQNADGLKNALAAQAAAKETIDVRRPRSATPEGQEACSAMEARLRTAQSQVRSQVTQLVNAARVYQGGGIEVSEGSFKGSIQAAVEAALVNLFPEFSAVDQKEWSTVFKRAAEGAADALSAVGYHGDVDKHKACKQVREFIGPAGKTGGEVRKKFMAPPYGWPQDAVDGCLLALLAGGLVRAQRNGSPVAAKGFAQSQVGVTTFSLEGVVITKIQQVGLRKFVQDAGLQIKPGEESAAVGRVLEEMVAAANLAGGEPPLPARPSTQELEQLRALSGNEQLAAVYAQRAALLAQYQGWREAQALSQARLPRWELLSKLLPRAKDLPEAAAVSAQAKAVWEARSLLTNPDPLPPLLSQLSAALRAALQARQARLTQDLAQERAALQAAPEWQALAESERQALLAQQQLVPPGPLQVGTDEALLYSLESSPLAEWDNRIAALPARAAAARAAAARRLAPEAVHVSAPHATLKTGTEVDAYLAQLRVELLQHIAAGKPVII